MALPERAHLNISQVRIWRRKSTAKNPYSLVVAFIGSSEDLGTWHRSMSHKGISTDTIAHRPMTSDELEREAKAYRLHFMQYQDWPGLIEDEWLVTKNTDWIQELITVSRCNLTVEQVVIKATFAKR